MKKHPGVGLVLLVGTLLAACAPTETTSERLPTLASVESSIVEPVLTGTTAQYSSDVYIDLYEQTNPGVVSINIYSNDLSVGQGSGFMFDTDGYILTNYHVVESALQVEVVFTSGYRAEGEVIGTDLDSDLAVIRVDVPADEVHPLPLGSSMYVKVGQTVVAIGNPYGLSGTMTVGIVSARGRLLDSMHAAPSGGYFTASDLIQTDAAINPGNSGGPLLNLAGEVIGVNRAIRTDGEDGVSTLTNSGIGFAVPIDIVRQVAPYLIENGMYDYPYLGIISREELTLHDRALLGLPSDQQGAYVTSVPKDGPAEKAGIIGGNPWTNSSELHPGGDFIIGVDGQSIKNFSELLNYMVINKRPGDVMDVTVLRDGEELIIPVVLAERPG